MAPSRGPLDLPALESWLWEAACVIRGPIDAPRFKDYILPLIFQQRLSDVFDDEVRHLGEEFGSEKNALKRVGEVSKDGLGEEDRRAEVQDGLLSGSTSSTDDAPSPRIVSTFRR